jgi:hypothetical protein
MELLWLIWWLIFKDVPEVNVLHLTEKQTLEFPKELYWLDLVIAPVLFGLMALVVTHKWREEKAELLYGSLVIGSFLGFVNSLGERQVELVGIALYGMPVYSFFAGWFFLTFAFDSERKNWRGNVLSVYLGFFLGTVLGGAVFGVVFTTLYLGLLIGLALGFSGVVGFTLSLPFLGILTVGIKVWDRLDSYG